MKDQLFNFDAINEDDWHLDILDTTILDFLLQPNYNHNDTLLDHDLSERNRLKAFDNFIKRPNCYILLNSIKQFLGGQSQSILRPNQIKMTLRISAAGPLPYFAKYIIEQLSNALNRNIQQQDQTLRITVDLTPSPRYQPIIPQHPSFDRRRKEWVIVNTNRCSEVGKIVEKNSVMTFLYQHWIICEGSDLLIKCAGCSTLSLNGLTSTGTCIRQGHFSKAMVIKVEVLTKKIEEASFRIITPTNLIKRRTITSTAAFHNEQKLITVDIPVIDHSRTPPTTKICYRALQRETNNIFQIYTDGSLDLNCRNFGGEVVMGASWIIKDHDLSFSCSVNYHPSSTRPELLAIMTALLAVPSNAEVAIYTDSQAAIDGINLRGHSGNRWNDMADEIAKQGRDAASCNNDRIVDIRRLCSFSFPLTFLPVWYNISIDRHIRLFIRLVADSLEEVQWSFNKYWSSYFEETFTTSRWHWRLFWQYVNSLNKRHCLSFSTNDKFIHFIKCSNNLLPTIDNLRKQNNLYNQVRCPMCLHDDEDIRHIVICPGHEDGFQQVELEVTSKIMKFIKKSASSTKIVQRQLECIIFEYKDEAFPLLKERNCIELTRGLISDTIITKLRRFLSRKVTNEVVSRIIKHFHNAFRKYIWNPRCSELNILEANLGITKKDKMNTVRSHSYYISQQLDIQQTHGTLDKSEFLHEAMTHCRNYIHSLITKGSSQSWKT
ncbi:unnamed protein product [Rhizophagus irregularis]|nr:unnamed protein product [Rhizophagus irregularis]